MLQRPPPISEITALLAFLGRPVRAIASHYQRAAAKPASYYKERNAGPCPARAPKELGMMAHAQREK